MSRPEPTASRWQPLRAGLVNLYYYDDEVFEFHQGRLLLRGNNGTGKSKVLALTLPLLLDAQLMPARVEPDGDSGKRIEWNLLMNGRHGERLGYSWLEFGRLDDTERAHFFTIGLGMRAVAGRPSVDRWFFTASLRPGADFDLVERDFPLGKDRLAAALGDAGALYTTAEQYRHAVDGALFGLGGERYRALVDLLVQLRQPQLSRKPDEGALSRALTEALPPIDRAMLTDVAESLTDLDAERAELEGLRESAAAVESFREHYARYAAIATRRTARTVRRAQSRFEETSQSLRQAREGVAAAEAREGELVAERDRARQAVNDARARQQALRQSEQMREAQALDRARQHAENLERHAESTEALRATRREEAAEHREALQRHEGVVADTRERVHAAEQRVAEALTGAGLTTALDDLRRGLVLPDGPAVAEVDALVGAAQTELERRRRGVEHVEVCNTRLARAGEATTRARAEYDRLSQQADAADGERRAAEAGVTEAGEAHVAAWREALAGARELVVDGIDGVLDATAAWTQTLDGPDPARAAAEAARERTSHALGEAHARLDAAREALETERAGLVDEYQRLQAGETGEPPLPPWRDPAVRSGREGAPLWCLIDFRAGVDEVAQAGLEGALEAAGLLDAWVSPDGRVHAPDSGDILAAADTDAAGPRPPGLTPLLMPAVDREDPQAGRVADATVTAVLREIAWCDGDGAVDSDIAVATDGRFRLGPAQGRWHKAAPAFIGSGAREAARRRRMAELTEALADVDARLEANASERTALAERYRVLQAEWAALPDDAALRAAHSKLAYWLTECQRVEGALEQAGQALETARDEEATARDARDRAAEDLDLPADADVLERVADSVAAAERALEGLGPTVARHFSALSDLAASKAAAERAEARVAEAEADATAERERARSARLEYETLRDSVGERVEALQASLEAAEREEQAAEAERERTEEARRDNGAELARLRTQVEEWTRQLERQDDERRQAVDALQGLHEDGLLRAAVADADAEVPERSDRWPLDPGVRLARRIEEALQAVADDDPTWERSRNRMHERVTELQQALSRHGHEAHAEQRASGLVVNIVFQGRRHSPDDLAAALAAEEAERARILDERERAILENHLIDEVARSLQELIRDAEEQVNAINRELQERPTSTGMRLRIRWQPLAEGDDEAIPAGLGEARQRLLRQTADAWSPDDRAAVGQFLKSQVDRVRESAEGGSLLDQLELALDYRRWHGFRIERWQDGQWRSARGPASGGERVLTVTLPLFAAASSHYRSGSPHAPRLIALDEAFAGVDDAARAQCMGLLAQFDLDFMMTSEREWGCYATIPGLAIAHLSRFEGIDAVHISRWRWDGRQCQRVPEPTAGASQADTDIATDGYSLL